MTGQVGRVWGSRECVTEGEREGILRQEHPYSAGWGWGNRQTIKDPRVRFAHWRRETYGFCQPFRMSLVGDGRNAARRGQAV